MSLFQTPGWDVPASAAPIADSNKKRKRPSEGGNGDKVEGATINLEKLMSLMEKTDQAAGASTSKANDKGVKKDKKEKFEQKPGQQQQRQNQLPKKDKKPHPATTITADGATLLHGRPISKKAKLTNPTESSSSPVKSPQSTQSPGGTSASAGLSKAEKKKLKKQAKQAAEGEPAPAATVAPTASPVKVAPGASTSAPPPPPPATSIPDENLTSMQLKMKNKLEGARFRWINEQLYTTSSDSALEMMKNDPTIFADYHQGFRSQTSTWPLSPIAHLTNLISTTYSSSEVLIIDLGCGDATLAKNLQPKGFKVLSFDLVPDDWVIECDFFKRIPLPGSSETASSKGAESQVVDLAVCSLALMGKNWVDGVKETWRVLKNGGSFEIAEVTSRLSSSEDFTAIVESIGFKLAKQDTSNTHFVLFTFKKTNSPSTPWSQGGKVSWEDVIKKGEEVLKPCVYKKR